MPRIFSWEEIPDKVPTLESFDFFGQLLRERLGKKDNSIMAALIYGSLPHNSIKRTSNIDLLVIYNPAKESGQPWLLQSLATQAAKRFVPLKFRIVDINSARLGTHRIDLSLKRHLESAARAGFAIKCDPLSLMRWPLGTESGEFFNYLRRKTQYLEDQLPFASESRHDKHFLESVIQTPLHVVRKLLPVQGLDLLLDTEEQVDSRYAECSGEQEYRLFKECLQIEAIYLQELERQLTQPNYSQYWSVLELIRNTAPRTLKFLKLIAHNSLGFGFEDKYYDPKF